MQFMRYRLEGRNKIGRNGRRHGMVEECKRREHRSRSRRVCERFDKAKKRNYKRGRKREMFQEIE